MIKLKDLLNEVNFRRFKVYVSGESEPLVLFGKDIKDAMQVARKMMQNSNKKITKVVKEEKLTEGKIVSDVERAAKKIGIKFKKKVKTKFTNDFTGPDEKGEKVKYDSWMDYNPDNYESMGRALVEALSSRYVQMKRLKYSKGGGVIFRKNRKDPKSQFTITYARSFSGPYISFEGVKGQ